jgi:hypothetical protein
LDQIIQKSRLGGEVLHEDPRAAAEAGRSARALAPRALRPIYGAHRRPAKGIASAHRFAYDGFPALKDPYDRAILQFFRFT